MRQNVLLQRITLQRFRFPNGTTFLASYERVSRKNLPAKVTIRRTRTIGSKNLVLRKIANKYKRQRQKK